MASPRPVPCPTSLVVKKGSKTRSRCSTGTPGPESASETTLNETMEHSRSRRGVVIAVGAAVVLGVLIAAALWLRRQPAAPAEAPRSDALSVVGEKVKAHLKAGRGKLEAHEFDAARAQLDLVLDLEPGHAEARTLRTRALAEIDNDQRARQVGAKAGLASDRAALEEVERLLSEIPDDSEFRAAAVTRLATRLTDFGQAECKARRYADCAWSLCRARTLAAAAETPDAVNALRAAEKRLSRSRSFRPCPVAK